MMDLLKRAQAPVTSAAWEQIDEECKRTLTTNLTARRVMDVSGPHGLEYGALNLGRLDVPSGQTDKTVRYGIRKVQPLIELRATIELDQWELDNADRGAEDVDLDPLTKAATQFARFEEQAIYTGLNGTGFTSLQKAAEHSAVKLGSDGASFPEPISEALVTLRETGIEGPYALVLGPKHYRLLTSVGRMCPPIQHVEHLIEGPVLMSPVLEGGFLLSQRGGDFEIVLGQDAALGWESHGDGKVVLFLMESFTFRVLEPRAVVPLSG
ncbi:MAG: bacteriocin [Candidatus Latescibacteria bacterium]|nr:bacteriocin [Candidatus Latescibacterota bacterium]